MPIYKPTELLEFLEKQGLSPRKGLSQNFLIDGNILRKIVKTAVVQPGDVVLEIGPGPGSLTEMLLEAGACVIAVERDVGLAKALERLKGPDRELHAYCEDIMEFPVEARLKEFLKGDKKAKVIANLPYHLTTPIIAMLAPMHELISSLTLMVQHEVAERFVAKPGTSTYSSFTVFLNYYCKPHYAFMVSRNCFFPPPKIQSAVVQLDLIPSPKGIDEKGFFLLTRTAFEHRRKMLRASLKEIYEPADIENALSMLGIDPQSRPERLSLEQFIGLFTLLNQKKC
jgi:16S rRNA (adenine1518-N6/adenine1519-N6)-dimethyltransferase